jgi:hypothetical protein
LQSSGECAARTRSRVGDVLVSVHGDATLRFLRMALSQVVRPETLKVRWRANAVSNHKAPMLQHLLGFEIAATSRRQSCFARATAHFTPYAARNIRTALATTWLMRLGEGLGAAWKMKGRNNDAWHISMNCEAAN